MSTENTGINSLEAAAEAAAELDAEAKVSPDVMTYTHTFKNPFEYRGHTMTELTFNWGGLTGADHLAIEDDLRRNGLTLVVPAFTGEFLEGMAVRACTNRDNNGIRIVDMDLLRALPIRDFQKICMSARRFLRPMGL